MQRPPMQAPGTTPDNIQRIAQLFARVKRLNQQINELQ